ncbi:MAG: hypothetical protein U0X86_000826 [Wolbachia endosymbiont of Xenopsylla cheopis]
MPENNTLSKRYDNFIGQYIKPKLEYLAKDDDKIRITINGKLNKYNATTMIAQGDTPVLYNMNTGCLLKIYNASNAFLHSNNSDKIMLENINACSLYTNVLSAGEESRYHSSSCTVIETWECEKKHIYLCPDSSIEYRFLIFIKQQLLSENKFLEYDLYTSNRKGKSFTREQLLQKLLRYKNKPSFYEIDITDVIEGDPIKRCNILGVGSVTTEGATLAKPNSSEEVTKWLSSTKGEYKNTTSAIEAVNFTTTTSPLQHNLNPTQAAATLTTIILSIATSLLTSNTTTPAIGYNNSTNTSIINDSFNTTTSRPEQDADAGQIAATAVVASIAGFLLVIIPFIIYYRENLKNYFKNCKNSDNLPKRAYSSENVQLISYREFEGEEGTSPVTIEMQPLLQNDNQASASTSEGIEISDEDASKVANAMRENSSPKRTQVQVHAEPSTAPQPVQNDGSQSAQCSGDGTATGSEGMPMSQTQLDTRFGNILKIIPSDKSNGDQPKIIQAAGKVMKELKPVLENIQPPSDEEASPLLQGAQIQGFTQSASSIG